MPLDPDVRRIILANRDQTSLLRARILTFVRRLWLGLGNYYDADINRFVRSVVPIIEGGKQQMASLTDIYLAAVEAAALGEKVKPVGVSPSAVTSEALRGVPASDVYQRAGVTVWTALGGGSDLTDAVTQGLERAVSMASTDLQLAKTHTARRVLSGKPHVSGYRRVLEGASSCALCIVASTQRYHKEALMPIHPVCNCGVEPIYGEDTGQIIEPDVLDNIHETIAERFGSSDAGAREIPGVTQGGKPLRYRDVIVVHEHGEVGPVLTVRGHKFTGPNDI